MATDISNLSDDELYEYVANAVFERVETGDGGTPLQRAIVGVHVASGLIGNRGLYDHDADDLSWWIESYEFLSMPKIALLLRKAISLMANEDDEAADQLDDLADRFYGLDEKVASAVAKAIRKDPKSALDQVT